MNPSQVVVRTLAGMFPVYWILVDSLGKTPDLYGPFWLSVTLIFTTALSGSLSKLLGWVVAAVADREVLFCPVLLLMCVVYRNSAAWELHFEKVTQMGTVVFSYICIVPACIWAVLWWRGNRQSYSLLQLLAIYGYSMGIFIPLSVSEGLKWGSQCVTGVCDARCIDW